MGSFFNPRRRLSLSFPLDPHCAASLMWASRLPHNPSGFCLAVTCSALPPGALTVPQSPLPWGPHCSPSSSPGAFTVPQGLHSFLGPSLSLGLSPLLSPEAFTLPWGPHCPPHCPLGPSLSPGALAVVSSLTLAVQLAFALMIK